MMQRSISHNLRVGLCPLPTDSFWLQVEQAIHRKAQLLPVELIPVYRDDGPKAWPPEDSAFRAEELLALELDALIGWCWSPDVAYEILETGLPIVHLSETSIKHPLSVSPQGLREASRALATFIAEYLAGSGSILSVGGLIQNDLHGDGSFCLDGIRETLAHHPQITLHHTPTPWQSDQAGLPIHAAMQQLDKPLEAVFGFSDPLALTARDIGRALNLVDEHTVIVGINGDPSALAAIAKGEMTATAALFPQELGSQAMELAYQAAHGGPLPEFYERRFQLVTAQNVSDVMADRLVALSSLPHWVVETSQQQQQQRLNQLEACLDIICRIQSRLDSHRQLREIVELMCAEYGYDRAKIYRYIEQEQRLFLVYPSGPGAQDVWYDLVGSSKDMWAQIPGLAKPGPSVPGKTGDADPGSLIIADGLGWIGDWYDVTGLSSTSVVDQVASWATQESKAFATEFEGRYGFKPSPSAAGLSYDYANMWIEIARLVYRDWGELTSRTLADFLKNRLLTGKWSYTQGCIMREYKYLPETAPDPVVGPHYFTFSVLEYVDGEGTAIFPSEPDERDLPYRGHPPALAEASMAGHPDQVFRLGVMGPFSGYCALVGREIRGAVEMAFDKAGFRVGPYQIELVWIDSQADQARAAVVYEQAILEKGIQAGLLNWHTPVAIACMELAAKYQIPHFFGLGGGSGVNAIVKSAPERYFYWVKGWPEPAKLTANYVQALEHAIAQGLWKPTTKTAALWGEDTDWGRSFASGLKKQIESTGWTIITEYYFPLHQTDFVAWLTQIKKLNPALVAGTASNPATFAAFVNQAYQLGLERMFVWSPGSQPSLPLEESDILGRALRRNEPVSIQYKSQSPAPPANWASADTRARLVLPIRHGDQVLGLIDLRSRHATWHTRLDFMGLQVLADQVGLAMWDAQLYGREAQARAIAEKSERSKSRLLANVSHEIRTPLNVILGYTQRALDSFKPYHADLPQTFLNDLEHIHSTSEHLLDMTDDLLDVARAEVGELGVFTRIMDPHGLVAEVFNSMAGAMGSDTVTWRLELPERLPLMKVDPVRLRQILFNLLSNARKFTDRGQITLGVEVALPHLHIWVQDSGVGIPAERQERIFEPFIRSEQPEPRREGIGLGLSIVRQLVELHHGLITLESRPGEGSTFHVYLPLPSLFDEPATLAAPVHRVLLLVSSEEQPAVELVDFCRRQGLEIRHVQQADALDRLLAEVEPAALAWDITCTDAWQWSTIEQIRRSPPLCKLPFIMYEPRQDDGPQAGIGLTNFVIKPVEAAILLDAIAAMRPASTQGAILVVEDDSEARSYFASLVARACPGYDVRTAADGATTLDLMAQQVPSLVLLDLMLPGIDGFQILEQMRSDERTSRVPILIMSGRVLSTEDIKRLERHALVTVHSKGILSDDEVATAVHRSLFGKDTLPVPTSALVKRAVSYCHQHYAESLTRREVAQAVGVSGNYLSQIFRRELGLSLWAYLARYRIKQAERLLRSTTDSIAAVALQVGFDDPAYFDRVFRRETGVSPTAYRSS